MEPSSHHEVVCFGEVLWDILPLESLPGGAPMNVAYHLKKLGTDPALITRIGTDDYGEKLLNILSAAGVDTDFFQVDYAAPTGLVYANANDHHEVIYDIVYPSAWDFIDWDDEFTSLLEEASFFVFGTLTSRNKESRDTLYKLLDIAKTKVLDINIRPPHISRPHIDYLLQKADILKMNEAELELVTGWFSRFESMEDRMKLMQDKFDISTLIVTMGGDGAIINDKGTFHRHAGYKVKVADTIGSGDSFLAGFIYQLLNGAKTGDALEFASAIGAFIATQPGACPPYKISQITDLLPYNLHLPLKTFSLTNKINIMRKLVYLLACVLLSAPVWAQQRITGHVVKSSTKEPLAGVSVSSKRGATTTDSTGQFSITASPGDELTVSYVGMQTTTVKVNGGQNLSVELIESASSLEQVVVVGYTSQRKQDLTGSVAVVEMTPAVKNNTSGNTMQALQGRVAGLYIEKDGSPNGSNSRILIRGSNTLGNNDPLYIIDGIPTTRPEVFQNINPNSIASVQVLKDASAASIYGSRASNGVIIVTTKNGGNTNGKVQFQFNSNLSAQSEKSMRFTMLNSVDRGKALWQASVNDRQDPAAGYGEIYTFDWNNNYDNPVLNSVAVKPFVGGDPNTPAGNTDWQSVMYKTGIVTNNALTISAGNKNSSVEMNLGYIKNTGMLRFTGYERYSGSLNALTRAFNNKLTFGINFNVANSNETLTARDIGGATTTFLAVTLAPTIPVYKKDGTTYAGELGAGYSDRNNPLHMQDLAKWNNANRLSSFGNIFAEIQPIKNLFFKSNIGADNAYFVNKVISPTFTEGALSRTTNSLSYDQNHFLSLTFSNTLRYNWNLNDNNQFKFLIGTEYVKTDLDFQSTRKEGFAIQTEDYFTLSSATGNTNVSGGSTGNRLFSQFGRLDYNFSDKYLAAVTVRRDGSSRFGADNRYGIFPAASVGWKIDKEAFMQNNKVFSELKLRFGIGRVGNQQIGDISRFALYDTRYGTTQNQLTPGFWEQYMNVGTAYSLSGANTGTLPSGFVQIQAANNTLKWETTDEKNVGLDFTTFHNKIYGSFDYFTRSTTGILITPPIASALGEGQTKPVNGASKSNKGWEFVIGYQGEKIGQLKYDIKLNFAHFRDKITELPENVRPAYAGNLINTIIGHSQFDIFGYKTDGLFQSQEEVDKAPTQIGAGPGRIKYVDVNNDGVINDLDRTWIGTTLPALEYGARIDLNYKNFDLSIFGSGVSGRKGFDVYTLYNNLMKSRENVGPGVFDGWTPQHTNTNIPALTLKDNNNEGRTSDYFIVNTSYFKLRNIQVGYNITPRAVFSRLRFFAMGENLFWFKSKSYQSPDPERIDLDPVPIPKTFTFGINASF